MEPIRVNELAERLGHFSDRTVYLHFELCRGGFVRNVKAEVMEAHLRGTGPWRVALRCQNDGWVIMESLSHMKVEGAALCLFGFDEEQKLACALQISTEPFVS